METTVTVISTQTPLERATERAERAEAYMLGMRAACCQPGDGLPARYVQDYHDGYAVVKAVLDEFARRVDRAQLRSTIAVDGSWERVAAVERGWQDACDLIYALLKVAPDDLHERGVRFLGVREVNRRDSDLAAGGPTHSHAPWPLPGRAK